MRMPAWMGLVLSATERTARNRGRIGGSAVKSDSRNPGTPRRAGSCRTMSYPCMDPWRRRYSAAAVADAAIAPADVPPMFLSVNFVASSATASG